MRSRDSLIRINDCKITANSTGRCMGVALAGQGNDLSIQTSTITAEKYHPVRAMGVDTTMNIAGSTTSGYCAISSYVGTVDLTGPTSTLNGRNTNDTYPVACTQLTA